MTEEQNKLAVWRVTENGNLICSEDFTFDAMLKLSGDFADDAQRIQYAEAIAEKLNAEREPATEAVLEELEIELYEIANSAGDPYGSAKHPDLEDYALLKRIEEHAVKVAERIHALKGKGASQ